MRLAGALLLAAAAAMAGLYAGRQVKKRVEQLEQCVSLVHLFSVSIGYGEEPLENIMQQALESEETASLSFLKYVVSGADNGFSERWSKAIDISAQTTALNSADCELLKSFGSKLGTTDVRRQLEICELYKQRFSSLLEQARLKQTERTRLCTAGGAAGGVLLFLLLI